MSLKKRMDQIKHEHTCAVCGKVCDELPGSCVVNGCEVCAPCWKEAKVWTDEGDKICQNCEEQFNEAVEND